MKTFRIFVVACITLLALDVYSNSFVINLPQPLETESFKEDIESFFIDSYKSVGITPTFVFTSAERGFKSMHDLTIGAEGYRADHTGDDLGNKYKLNTRLAEVNVAIFCKTQNKCQPETYFNYAIQHGFRYGKFICEQLNINCTYERSPTTIAKLLDNKMIDAVISPYPSYQRFLCSSKAYEFYYKPLDDYSFDIFHFTNISNEMDREKLDKGLQRNLVKFGELFKRYSSVPKLSECNKQLIRVTSDYK